MISNINEKSKTILYDLPVKFIWLSMFLKTENSITQTEKKSNAIKEINNA